MLVGRVMMVAVSTVLVGVLAMPAPAFAVSSAAQLEARIKALDGRLAAAGAAYQKAQWSLDHTEAEIRRADRNIVTTNRQLAAARIRLRSRATGIYMQGQPDIVSMLLGADSVSSFLTRLDYFQALADQDAEAVTTVKTAGAKLRAERKRLASARAVIATRVRVQRRNRTTLQSQLSSQQAAYKTLKAQLAAARKREQAAAAVAGVSKTSGSGGSSSPSHRKAVAVSVGANGMAFPVAGPCYYSDDFGAARTGHSHKGNDLMASGGTPIVAVTDGTISTDHGSSAGNWIRLRGANYSFWYMHMQGFAVSDGASVKAGQVIGWVGDTGNAGSGNYHLHFEIHPGGGSAVDPHPYLQAMQR